MEGNEHEFAPELLTTPLLIGCTWYTHLYGVAPWGVAQADLFQTPQALLFPNRVLCDRDAADAEKAAFDAFNWTSSELFLRAVDRKLITLDDFRSPIAALSEVHRTEVDGLLGGIREGSAPLAASRTLDAKFTDWLLGSPGIEHGQPKPKQAFYYEASGEAVLRPGWALAPGVVVTEVFVGPDFYLLPPLNPAKAPPGVLIPGEVVDAIRQVSVIQKEPLNQLAALKLSQQDYLHRLKPLEGEYDLLIDGFQRTHRDREGRNYLERLDYLIGIRKRLHRQAVLEALLNRLRQYNNNELTREEMVEALDNEVSAQIDNMIRFRQQTAKDLKLQLAVALSSSAALGVSLRLLPPGVFQSSVSGADVVIGGVAGNAWSKVVDTMVKMWRLRDRYPLAFLRGGRRSA